MAHGLPSESLSSGTIPPRPSSINTFAPTNGLTGQGRCKPERRGKLQTQGQSYGHVSAMTINRLPDSVLLEIFDLCRVNHDDTRVFPFRPLLEWRRLVHVCLRWRHIVFASPIRLGLQLLCTRGTPVRKNLGYWPPFPLIIDYHTYWGADDGVGVTLRDQDDVIAALEHPDRIRYTGISVTRSLLGKMAAAMQESFPMLTHLRLSSEDENFPILPKGFLLLGGSAPSLRVAHIEGIPFPSLPNLLLSAAGLVNLQLLNIPKTGFVSPGVMVAGLAALTRLKTLSIEFQSSTHVPKQRPLPPPTRIAFPSLTTFNFRGASEYLEDLVAQIDTPLLKNVTIMYFNRLTFQIPQLSYFIGRTESLDLFRFKHARVDFGSNNVYVRLDCDQVEQLEGHFTLQISCQGLEWQVPHMAQVLGQCFPIATLSSTDDLFIDTRDLQPSWKDVNTTEWQVLLRSFTAMETLHISINWGGVAVMLTARDRFVRERTNWG